MKVTALAMVVVGLTLAGATMYGFGPGFRTHVDQRLQGWLGWTENARRTDPVGFADHVEAQLKRESEGLKATRDGLASEVGTLNRKLKEQQALLEHSQRMAEEFRGVYQTATDEKTFPVTVRNAAYTEGQLVSQVSLLLAETAGYREMVDKLENVRQNAEAKLEALTVRINSTESQLTMLATQRGLLRARVLTDEGERLIAQVDELLEGNRQVVQDNPVRNVTELLAATGPKRSNCRFN